jgi:ferric iron reductase protein FhuF
VSGAIPHHAPSPPGKGGDTDGSVAEIDRLLARVGSLSSYGVLDGPNLAAHGQPLDDPRRLLEHVGRQLGTPDPMVAASVGFQAVTSRVMVPIVLANELLGRAVDARFASLRWRVVDGQIRLGITAATTGPAATWPDLVDGLVRDVAEPWVATMRTHARVGARLLWGDAADSLVSAVREAAKHGLEPAREAALAREGLARFPLPNLMVPSASGTVEFRRTTCCLIDKVPGYGRCGSCSLDRAR